MLHSIGRRFFIFLAVSKDGITRPLLMFSMFRFILLGLYASSEPAPSGGSKSGPAKCPYQAVAQWSRARSSPTCPNSSNVSPTAQRQSYEKARNVDAPFRTATCSALGRAWRRGPRARTRCDRPGFGRPSGACPSAGPASEAQGPGADGTSALAGATAPCRAPATEDTRGRRQQLRATLTPCFATRSALEKFGRHR